MTRDDFYGRLLQLPELVSRIKSPSRTVGSHQNLINSGGMEFVDTAPFKPGDDLREFSPILTERRGEDTRRINRDDRDLHVLVLVDIRQSLSCGVTRPKREFAIEVAGVLGLTALKADDMANVAALSLSKPFAKPRGTRDQRPYMGGLLALWDASSETDDASVGEVLQQAVALIPKSASVYIVSDWIYCQPDPQRPTAPLREQALYRNTRHMLEMLRGSRQRGREVGLVAIQDKSDIAVPAYLYRLRSSRAGKTGVFDGTSKRQQEARRKLCAERQEWLDDLTQAGIDHCILETDVGYDYLADLMAFFARRRM